MITALGAELEFARGCPWACTFCNKTLFRNKFRGAQRRCSAPGSGHADCTRASNTSISSMKFSGVGKKRSSLARRPFAERPVEDRFPDAHRSLERRRNSGSSRPCPTASPLSAAWESITREGREDLNKNCRMGTNRIAEIARLCPANAFPWVQANLILTERDDRAEIHRLAGSVKRQRGVWGE